jgi:hypothetical protein
VTNEALIAKSSHTVNDVKGTLSDESRTTIKAKFKDYDKNPLQIFGAKLKAIFISSNSDQIGQVTSELLDAQPGYGLTGPGNSAPNYLVRYTIDDPRGIGTSLHDITSIDDQINLNR